MRVLVTGVAGFVGSHVARHLVAQGFNVTGNHRGALLPNLDGILQLRRDLSEAASFPPFDAVVHTAAAAGPWHKREVIERDNIEAMKALVRAASEWKAKFIFCSSISVYGRIKVPVVDEQTPSNDPDEYGKSKIYGERLLRFTEEIPSIALRLPGIIGPGCNGRNWIPRLATLLKSNVPVAAFNLEGPFNNAVHVVDLVRFVEHLLRKHWTGHDAVVLGAKGTLPVKTVIERLSKGLGSTVAAVESMAAPGPMFTLSSARAMEKWGYDPMEVGPMIDRFAKEFA